jgi:2'-5' RNA ligase
MKTSWRVFCAVELPDDVREQLRDHITRLREAVPDVAASWSRVENVHLTLKFFGNVEVERIDAISAAASRTVGEFSSFPIGIGGTGVFPRPSRPQVLWIGVSDPVGQLAALQKKFDDETADFGTEDRAFRPHLTIARIRRPEGGKRLADAHLKMDFKPVEIILNEVIVFRSELSPQGSRYTPISHHLIRGNP